MIRRLEAYDQLRLTLEHEGGTLEDIATITGLLKERFQITGRACARRRADRRAQPRALDAVGDFDLYLDVRRLPTGMPVYYLCRTEHDWWGEYDFVVEDLYRSPGYQFMDERFARLMRYAGHETYFLRLSPFRDAVQTTLHGFDADDVLFDVGRHVFNSAWHEDQTLGLIVAKHFQLPQFARAVEVLYLALSGDLCELRSVAHSEPIVEFLRTVYPQPAITALLSLLVRSDGDTLNGIPERALKLYARLSKAFGRFIEVRVTSGHRRVRLPLYKLIFANVSNLEPLAGRLRKTYRVVQAAKTLEQESQRVIDDLLATKHAGELVTTS